MQIEEVNNQVSRDFYSSFFIDLSNHDASKKLILNYFLFLAIHLIGSCIEGKNP